MGIADLRNVNKVVEKVKKENNKVVYTKVGEKEDLQIIGIVDASYKTDDKAIGGMMMMIANKELKKASPVMWKAKQIERVCHSSKDAETLALSKILDETTYLARQIELLLFGKYEKKIPVRIITDSEPLLESIASTKQVDRWSLRMTVQELKDRLMSGEVKLYQWIPTKEMWADGLTKEMEMADGVRKMLREGVCNLKKEELNMVVCENEEIRMLNIRNRKKKEEGEEETQIR